MNGCRMWISRPALATIIDKRTPVKTDLIHTSWVILLLMVHFNLFWHVLDILSIESWSFIEFLYIVCGAIIIFFATQVILPDPSSPDTDNMRAYYFGICRQFFFFLALLQIWILGVDFIFGDGFTTLGIFNIIIFFLAAVMAYSQHPKLHSIGTGFAWILYFGLLLLKGLGVFQ